MHHANVHQSLSGWHPDGRILILHHIVPVNKFSFDVRHGRFIRQVTSQLFQNKSFLEKTLLCLSRMILEDSQPCFCDSKSEVTEYFVYQQSLIAVRILSTSPEPNIARSSSELTALQNFPQRQSYLFQRYSMQNRQNLDI